MWFKRKQKPVRMELGQELEIYVRTGGVKHLLVLTDITSDMNGTRALFTDRKSLLRA